MTHQQEWREKFKDYWFEGYNGKDTQGQEKFREYVEDFISHEIELAEKRGIEKVLQVLPPEVIIHSYMKNNPEDYGYNQYRLQAMEAIAALKK